MMLLLGSDNILWARGAHTISLASGLPVYLDAAVIARVTLYAADGVTEIGGEDWPVNFTYIVGSQGDFLAPLRAGIEAVAQDEIVAHVSFLAGTDQLGDWRGRIVVQERTF